MEPKKPVRILSIRSLDDIVDPEGKIAAIVVNWKSLWSIFVDYPNISKDWYMIKLDLKNAIKNEN